MPEPTAYEIVIRGRASARLLRPLLDDFTLDLAGDGVTRLIGDIRDASHLHGVVAHLTSVNTELISIAPLRQPPEQPGLTDPSSPHPSSPHPSRTDEEPLP